MADTVRAFVGVRDVSFTPDGEDALPIPCLDALDEDVTVETIAHTNADGVHDVFARVAGLSRRVTVRSKDLAALAALAPNAQGTLAWTLVGKGLAADRAHSARARVLRPVAFGGGDGLQPAVGSVVLQLLSETGPASPIQ